MVKVKFPKIACQKVLKQNCHKSVLRIKEKLKKIDFTSLVSTEKKLTKVLYFLNGSIGQKRCQLKNVSLILNNVFSQRNSILSTHITIKGTFSCLLCNFHGKGQVSF